MSGRSAHGLGGDGCLVTRMFSALTHQWQTTSPGDRCAEHLNPFGDSPLESSAVVTEQAEHRGNGSRVLVLMDIP